MILAYRFVAAALVGLLASSAVAQGPTAPPVTSATTPVAVTPAASPASPSTPQPPSVNDLKLSFTFVMTTPPPPYAKVGWKHGDQLYVEYLLPEKTVIDLGARMDYLTKQCATDCVTKAVTAAQENSPLMKWVWLGLGVVVGAVGGVVVAKTL